MFKFFRNPEVLLSLIINIIILTISTGLSFYFSINYLFVLALGTIYIMFNLLFSYLRYRKISELTLELDKILHGDMQISLDKFAEGELGILQSEIYKMTVRMREQKQQLLNDKTYLADSIADISHQMRTPLTSINLVISLLKNKDITDSVRKNHHIELSKLMQRVESLVNALLKISKLDAGTVKFNPETISLSYLIEKACDPLLVPIDIRGQELVIDCVGDITCDIAWTVEAIGNVVKNAMDHCCKGGKIYIKAHTNAIYSEIVVEDEGSGIDKSDLPYIFDRFYKGKNYSENSIGIGLSLSRMIITSQDGTIKAENNPSCGAKFTIRFYKGTV